MPYRVRANAITKLTIAAQSGYLTAVMTDSVAMGAKVSMKLSWVLCALFILYHSRYESYSA